MCPLLKSMCFVYIQGFNTSWNMYYISNKRSVDNFWDSFRLREFTVGSVQEAVDKAVDHYIQDQVINK